MTTGKKTISFIALAIVVVIIAFVAGRYVLFMVLETRIKKAVASLSDDGVYVNIDSLYSDPWKRSVTLKGIRGFVNHTGSPNDSVRTSTIDRITVDAIELLPLIFEHKLSVGSVIVEHPVVSWPENFRTREKKTPGKKKIHAVIIRQLTVVSSSLELTDSLNRESKKLIFNSFKAGGLVFENTVGGTDWRLSTSSCDSMALHLAKEFYTIKINRSMFDATEKTMAIDSIHILPDYDRQLFAKKSVRQTDRIEGVIPAVRFHGISISKKGNLSLEASRVSLNLNLHVFRDKRYPFHNGLKTLPVRFLRRLPVSIQIDTVALEPSYVRYDEFQEAGDSAGYVYFDKLQASIYNVSNLSPKETTMDAEGDFMDAGKLTVHFRFPADPDKEYHILGALTNFSLPAINSMLVPAANARIHSGKMEEMKFHFVYNDTRSDGEVTLNYTNLKMASTKKSNIGSKIVTFLLNTFIRNDMDRTIATDKKTGTILFYRDHHRAIFNYWWKSLLSGIKSVYNLDKITNTHTNKK